MDIVSHEKHCDTFLYSSDVIFFMILISSGEPAGIGPDIILKLMQRPEVLFSVPWVVLGDIALFKERAKICHISIEIRQYTPGMKIQQSHGVLWIWHIELNAPVSPGKLNTDNAAYVLTLLRTGAEACMQGLFDALVTAPIHKGVIADAGYSTFIGHTEYFAELTHTPEVVMMLADQQRPLRVALVTTHLPLRDVPDAITAEKLTHVITIIHDECQKYFGLAEPRIYVCGLNPHAGENGHLGREEIDIIAPVIRHLNKTTSMHIKGPLPADSLFTSYYQDKADVFLAMYHDQGLSVMKYAAFDTAVNITLGLPFIRTSVDHGTALDLAGTGKASENSLIQAMHMAIVMYENKQ